MNHLKKEIDSLAKEIDFWGNVSVNQNGKNVIEQSYGYRDLSNKLELNINTSMGLASGTKSFTAVGIGLLVGMGKLSFNTTMKEIFKKEYPFISGDATVSNLLSHNSGIFDYYDEELVEDFDNYKLEIPWFELETPEDYWPLFCDKKMKFTPGERVSYSNGGFVLLGIIIERVSGMLFRDFMTKYLFSPAKMESSGFFAFNDLPENCALGYLEADEKLKSNIYNLPIRGGADGGLYTNCSDLITFWNKFLNAEIIKDKSVLDLYLNPQVKFDDGCGYSYGIYLPKPDYGNSLVMIGGDVGVGFISKIIRDKNLIFSVISNKTEGEEQMRTLIEDRLG